MALVDLANYDILELTLAKFLPAVKQDKLLRTFMEAYTTILCGAISKDLKPEDNEEMDVLLASPDVTPEAIDKFYQDKIPDFSAKITLLALEFKKRFILDVYKNKIESYKNSEDKTGLAAWEQIFYDASHDNWDEVARLLTVLESIPSSTSHSSK